MTIKPPTISAEIFDVIREHITASERRVYEPYLDIKGQVTVGVGFLADSADSFAALDLEIQRDGQWVPATNTKKRHAFKQMQDEKSRRKGNFSGKSKTYKSITAVRMSDPAMDAKLDAEITERVGRIRGKVGDAAWRKLDDAQKAAVVDIVYANGSLDKFPKLKDAIIAGDRAEMAVESTFYADSENGVRPMDRLRRNYAALSGASQEDAARELDQLIGDNGEDIDDQASVSVSAKDAQHATKSEDGDDTMTPTLHASLIKPGDAIDEKLLAADLSEADLGELMRSEPYHNTREARHGVIQRRVAKWYDDHYGTAPATVDGTGRIMVDEMPAVAIPERSPKPPEASTGRSLDEAIKTVAENVTSTARRSNGPLAVKSLQWALNENEDVELRPVPPLMHDGRIGPKT